MDRIEWSTLAAGKRTFAELDQGQSRQLLFEWFSPQPQDLLGFLYSWRYDLTPEILKYNEMRDPSDKEICDVLAVEIDLGLSGAESKIWHAHPVWFLDGNPIVGYSKQKLGIRLMFWSGADFDEVGLKVIGKKFKDASVFYIDASEIKKTVLRRWLKKSKAIQWDYKNIVRRKGKLERLK